jgi:hypothetical protein
VSDPQTEDLTRRILHRCTKHLTQSISVPKPVILMRLASHLTMVQVEFAKPIRQILKLDTLEAEQVTIGNATPM